MGSSKKDFLRFRGTTDVVLAWFSVESAEAADLCSTLIRSTDLDSSFFSTDFLRSVLILFPSFSSVILFSLGTVTTRTPSCERLLTTCSSLVLGGRPYCLLNCLDTMSSPAWLVSWCLPSMTSSPSPTFTLSSPG